MTNAASVSKPRTLRIAVVIAAALSLVTCSRESRSVDPYLETVMIPAGSLLLGSRDERASRLPRRFDTEGFHLGRVEVTCGFFERYLRDVETSNSWSHPQFEHRDGVLRAKNPAAPLAWVTQDEAQHFCDWLTLVSGQRARLPSRDEWEYAARGGIQGAMFPWGWSNPSTYRGDAAAPVFPERARHRQNRYGLYDVSGGLAEWCSDAGSESGRAWAAGGSWADRGPALHAVWSAVSLPDNYRDADTGFRILLELK